LKNENFRWFCIAFIERKFKYLSLVFVGNLIIDLGQFDAWKKLVG
jgi:hypothetical protein